jgi:hypothetical protein
MKLIYAKNPVWANRSKTLINLTVRFEEINEDLPFTANPNDSETHGREIYSRASVGEFGAVAPFNPIPPTIEEVSQAVRQERNYRLETEVDPVVSNPLRWNDLPQEKKQSYVDYRLALLNMTNSSDFPWYNQVVVETDMEYETDLFKAPWPTKPT